MEIVGYEVYEAEKLLSNQEARDFSRVRFTKFRNEIMSELIKRMFTEKEIYEMYKLILIGKIN